MGKWLKVSFWCSYGYLTVRNSEIIVGKGTLQVSPPNINVIVEMIDSKLKPNQIYIKIEEEDK